MSLDVYLDVSEPFPVEVGAEKIFIRESGGMREISRAEWDDRFPDREPVTCRNDEELSTRVYHANITHNLGRMAGEVDLYGVLWRPDEIGITTAKQLIEPLRAGLVRLIHERQRLQEFNPENGWGTYDGLVEFTRNYLAACEDNPEAAVSVWR